MPSVDPSAAAKPNAASPSHRLPAPEERTLFSFAGTADEIWPSLLRHGLAEQHL